MKHDCTNYSSCSGHQPVRPAPALVHPRTVADRFEVNERAAATVREMHARLGAYGHTTAEIYALETHAAAAARKMRELSDDQ